MSTQRQQYGSHPLGGMLKIEDFGRYVRIQRHLWVAVVIRSSVHDIYEKTISSCVRIFGEMNKVDIGIINFWNFILDNNSPTSDKENRHTQQRETNAHKTDMALCVRLIVAVVFHQLHLETLSFYSFYFEKEILT